MRRTLRLGPRVLGDGHPPYVLAEVGSNHEGSPALAHALVDLVADAGADAVKFQKRELRVLYTRAFAESAYASPHAYAPTYGAHRAALELPDAAWPEVFAHARQRGLEPLATPFDAPSAAFLACQGVRAFKVASASITNTPLLGELAQYRLPLLVSTGHATLPEIDQALDVIGRVHAEVALLHCTAEYPCGVAHLNLAALGTLRERYPATVIGYSSHFPEVWDGPVARALGAAVFEKHVTDSRSRKGKDHQFSLTRALLAQFCDEVRAVDQALGDGQKRAYAEEEAAWRKMASSVYTARAIPAGTPLSADDLVVRSPGGGCPPVKLGRLVGRTFDHDLPEEYLLSS